MIEIQYIPGLRMQLQTFTTGGQETLKNQLWMNIISSHWEKDVLGFNKT